MSRLSRAHARSDIASAIFSASQRGYPWLTYRHQRQCFDASCCALPASVLEMSRPQCSHSTRFSRFPCLWPPRVFLHLSGFHSFWFSFFSQEVSSAAGATASLRVPAAPSPSSGGNAAGAASSGAASVFSGDFGDGPCGPHEAL